MDATKGASSAGKKNRKFFLTTELPTEQEGRSPRAKLVEPLRPLQDSEIGRARTRSCDPFVYSTFSNSISKIRVDLGGILAVPWLP